MTNENCSALGIEQSRCAEIFETAFMGTVTVSGTDEEAKSKFIIENGISDKERDSLLEFGKELEKGQLPDDCAKQFSDIMQSLSKYR